MNLNGILLLGNDMIIPRDTREWGNPHWRTDSQVEPNKADQEAQHPETNGDKSKREIRDFVS